MSKLIREVVSIEPTSFEPNRVSAKVTFRIQAASNEFRLSFQIEGAQSLDDAVVRAWNELYRLGNDLALRPAS